MGPEMTDDTGADLVVGSIGPATWRQGTRSLAKGGALVVCATSGDVPRSAFVSRTRAVGASWARR